MKTSSCSNGLYFSVDFSQTATQFGCICNLIFIQLKIDNKSIKLFNYQKFIAKFNLSSIFAPYNN